MLKALRSEQGSRILIGTVLEVEIVPKVTALGRRSTFAVKKIDLGGGDMKVDNINISSVKLHTLENLSPDTDVDGGYISAAVIMTTTGDKTITDQVYVQFFKAPAPYPLNDEVFRVVVSHPMV